MTWLRLLMILILLSCLLIVISLVVYMFVRSDELNDIAEDGTLNPLYGHDTPYLSESPHADDLSNMSIQQLNEVLQSLIRDQTNTSSNGDTNETNTDQSRSNNLLNMIMNRRALDEKSIETYKGTGSGIVLCTSGGDKVAATFVQLEIIRKNHHCDLPIEIWYRAKSLDDAMIERLNSSYKNICVRHIDTVANVVVYSDNSMRALACLYSQFQKLLLVDENVIFLRSPSQIFRIQQIDEEEQKEQKERKEQKEQDDSEITNAHAIFWHDHWRLRDSAQCWKLLNDDQKSLIHYPFGQSGALVFMNKAYCVRPLHLCSLINYQLHSQLHRLFPGPYNRCDRDTWHFSWLVCNRKPYFIPQRPGVIGTRDSNGNFLGQATLLYNAEGDSIAYQYLNQNWLLQYESSTMYLQTQQDLSNEQGSISPTTYETETDHHVYIQKFNHQWETRVKQILSEYHSQQKNELIES